jgi:phage shock protein A
LIKTSDASMAAGGGAAVTTFDRMKSKVSHAEAMSQARAQLAGDDFEDRLAALGKEDEIEKLLNELKARRRS